jgi:hypothetical protein
MEVLFSTSVSYILYYSLHFIKHIVKINVFNYKIYLDTSIIVTSFRYIPFCDMFYGTKATLSYVYCRNLFHITERVVLRYKYLTSVHSFVGMY